MGAGIASRPLLLHREGERDLRNPETILKVWLKVMGSVVPELFGGVVRRC